MAKTPTKKTWTAVAILGLIATLMGIVALLIDMIQGDPMNWAVLPSIGAGLLVTSLALAQRKKTKA